MSIAEPRITRMREVPPDPSIAQAVGRHHTFETAIADLIDNSIDATATRVLLRFLERDGEVVGIRLIDDGRGMDSNAIDNAMAYARRRQYVEGDQGHFGIGLKAASLSQADGLRVYSQRFGAMPSGRAIKSSSPTTVAELDGEDVAGCLGDLRVDFEWTTGTVVEWVEPRTFLSSTDASDRNRWLAERISTVMAHLGLVFHRKIESHALTVEIDVFDLDQRESGPTRIVRAIDPFGYSKTPGDSFPTSLSVDLDGPRDIGALHIWPPAQSGKPEYRLGGKPGALHQGFYFYRNDRLLQSGGWNTLTVARPELEYARVAIDIDESLAKYVTINPEKAGLELTADFKQALARASVGNSIATFGSFLESAEDVRRQSRRYTKRPVSLVEPARGFGADMLDAFAESVDFEGPAPVDIRWRVLPTEAPLQVDLENRTIWLNEQYRDIVAGKGSMEAADAPFVKTLLTIAFSKYFAGSHLGSREKLELAAWEQLLTAALRDEIARETQVELTRGDINDEGR
jgi:hypothetical protein